MEYTKTIKDHRGTVKVIVKLVTFGHYGKDINGNEYRYDVRTTVILPRKRTEIYDNTIATQEEILSAKLELWQIIKPI